MKSILISVNPKFCEKIASGEKTIEVRRTRPKIETPFKCYIYCTRDKDLLRKVSCVDKTKNEIINLNYCTNEIVNGKVIGEFICNRLYEFTYNHNVGEYNIGGDSLKRTCLTYDELKNYGKGKDFYGWHISDLKIYDKPKELNEFGVCGYEWFEWYGEDQKVFYPLKRPPQGWQYVETQGE